MQVDLYSGRKTMVVMDLVSNYKSNIHYQQQRPFNGL